MFSKYKPFSKSIVHRPRSAGDKLIYLFINWTVAEHLTLPQLCSSLPLSLHFTTAVSLSILTLKINTLKIWVFGNHRLFYPQKNKCWTWSFDWSSAIGGIKWKIQEYNPHFTLFKYGILRFLWFGDFFKSKEISLRIMILLQLPKIHRLSHLCLS